MQIYLFTINLLTLAAWLLGAYGLPKVGQSWRLWPLFLLTVARPLILIVLLTGGEPDGPLIAALEGVSVFCLGWLLLESISNLAPLRRQIVRGGLTVSFLATLPPLLPGWPIPFEIHHLTVAMIGTLLIFVSASEPPWVLVLPLLAALASFTHLLALTGLSLFVNFGVYASLIGAVYWQSFLAGYDRPAGADAEHLADKPEALPEIDQAAQALEPPPEPDKIKRNGNDLEGRYEIKDEVGQGAFSTVYRAYDQRLRSDVAVKKFNAHSAARFGDPQEMQRRFEQEALITRRLQHPHIVEIYDFFCADDTCYIVMPYLPDTLAKRLERSKHFKVTEAVQVMSQICEGLAYAHTFQRDEKGPAVVVHCDIKPGNILFDKHNRVKITDFGIAHVPAAGDMTDYLDHVAFRAGTIFYMAPEQLKGKRDDPRIDVYALGALLYQMLAGRYYLDFNVAGDVLAQAENMIKIAEYDPSLHRLQDIPPYILDIIRTAVSKQPQKRYKDAGMMLKALTAPAGSTPPKTPETFNPPTVSLPLVEAQALSRRLGHDFVRNKPLVEKMTALYDEVPTNPELRALTLTAVTGLVKLALSSSDHSQAMWEALRLFYPFYTEIKPRLEPADADRAAQLLQQLEKQLARACLRQFTPATPVSDRQIAKVRAFIQNHAPDIFSLTYPEFVTTLKKGKV